MSRANNPGTGAARPGVGIVLLAAAVAATASCSAGRVDEEPVIRQGGRIPAAVDTVRPEASGGAKGSGVAEALTTCRDEICGALARGAVTLGMTRQQVQAASRNSPTSWRVRRSGEVTVMTPSDAVLPPDDARGSLAWIQLRDGTVVRYAYFEHQGVRLVSDPEDATLEGRAEARGRRLLEEGDELVARGDWERALDRFDRAAEFRDGQVGRIARTLVRAAVKQAAVEAVSDAGSEDEEEWLELAGTVVGVVTAAVERADTRCWHLLPARLSVHRLILPSGIHELVLELAGTERGGARRVVLDPVQVSPGRVTVVTYRVWPSSRTALSPAS